jgi:hypothetical protein
LEPPVKLFLRLLLTSRRSFHTASRIVRRHGHRQITPVKHQAFG